MDEQYFSQNPSSAHAERTFDVLDRGRALRFGTDAGVFSKAHLDKGTALLLDALPDTFAGRALDLGCGWGAIGVCMAARWPQADVTLSDINERAVDLARKNLARNGLRGTVTQGDGLARVDGDFDLIATNPPIRAGKAVIYALFSQSAARLREGGALYVVARKQQGAESILAFLRTLLPRVEVVRREGGGFRVLKGEK